MRTPGIDITASFCAEESPLDVWGECNKQHTLWTSTEDATLAKDHKGYGSAATRHGAFDWK